MVTAVLVKIILVDNSDALLECTRVYGNLSRHPAVRKILADNKGKQMNCLSIMSIQDVELFTVFKYCIVIRQSTH